MAAARPHFRECNNCFPLDAKLPLPSGHEQAAAHCMAGVHSGLHGDEADAAVVCPGRGGMRWGARARRWHATPGAGDHGAALGREEGGGREGAGWEWERVVKGRRELVLVI